MGADWVTVKRGDVMPQYAGLYVTMNRNGRGNADTLVRIFLRGEERTTPSAAAAATPPS